MMLDLGDNEMEEIISYNELCDLIQEQSRDPTDVAPPSDRFTFQKILSYEGPIRTTDVSKYKGCSWNVLLLWDDGSETWEPLNLIAKDDPLTCARFAVENDLLKKPGWKFLRKYAKRIRFANLALNAAKPRFDPNQIRYKFGVRIPRNCAEAKRLDEENKNTFWQDAIRYELDKLADYNVFKDNGNEVPDGHIKIHLKWVFDVKADGRRRARIVARGDLTPSGEESSYSSVAGMRSVRIVTFLAELNDLELWQGDIASAYLTAETSERVFIKAGPEFGVLAGRILIVKKALYGLKMSGVCFHQRASRCLREMGFTQSYADADVWMRDAGDVWEYVVVYVDDLMVALKDPKSFFERMTSDEFKFTIADPGPIKYHLGGDFFRDNDGTLCYGAQTYAKRLMQTYEQIYGELPTKVSCALDPDDRPELDRSELCTPDETAKFQSLIGACQWMISLCRFDIVEAVMSLNRFRCAPRVGHLERLKRLCGYIRKQPHAAIRMRTGIPDHESQFGATPKKHNWMETVYGNPQEEIPYNMPEPKGNLCRTTTFVDANLMHDVITGRSCTGILHCLNQTPIDWFGKRQPQVESATYGSEFYAARTAVEQIMDLRYTLRMLGVRLDGPSWLLGDNKTVVNSSTLPHSTLSKRWNAISYHRCREAISANIVRFEHISGSSNPADLMTAARPWSKAKQFLEPLLFWKGDVADSYDGASRRGVTDWSWFGGSMWLWNSARRTDAQN